MTLCTLALALLMSLGGMQTPESHSTGLSVAPRASCGHWTSRLHPPKYIWVFRAHHRGSKVKARVERVLFKTYVGRVMASGAWPNRPRESAKAGAIMIKQYAWWMAMNHQPGHSWHGQCYDITDSEQYYTDHRIPVRTAQVVRITWPVSLRKNGSFKRMGWSGGNDDGTGWHLAEDSARALAHSGAGWRTILRHFLNPRLRIVGDYR